MGREGQWIEQPVSQPINIAEWKGDEEFEVYPEGARDKSLLKSPEQSEYGFLIPNHRYLFKHSFARHPDQFWTEIIAYQVGCMLEIPVPPAFVAFDSDNNVCSALIEWFVGYPGQPEDRFFAGGDIMVSIIHGFDRKKGRQHNFSSIEKHFSALKSVGFHVFDWLNYWCDMLLFDALIGNTDRHQDNWGVLWNQNKGNVAYMAPVFDNGTSLGYEILESKMANFTNPTRMQTYINKGRHHLRWHIDDESQCQHVDFLVQLLEKYPELKNRIKNTLTLFQKEHLRSMMTLCTKYRINIPLSQARADFVCDLVVSRFQVINKRISAL